MIDFIEAVFIMRIAEKAVQVIEIVVTGSSLHRPVRRKLFIAAQYFFDYNVVVNALPGEPLKILIWMIEPVYMVNPDTINMFLTD
jgi:hypothetical protein